MTDNTQKAQGSGAGEVKREEILRTRFPYID